MALTQVDASLSSTRRDPGSVVARSEVAAAGVLIALAAAAWVETGVQMAGMDGGPGSYPTALGRYVSTWIVMMAAMMLPSIVPTVWKYAGTAADHARGLTAGVRTGAFVCGYLAVWTFAGLLAYGLLRTASSLDDGLFAWHREGRFLVAGALAAAAVYEFTSLKRASLRRCRAPVTARVGSNGATFAALRVGFESGVWCLGCCWALMIALFALGEMSLTWMILIAAVITVEKLVARRLATVGAALVLVVLAVGVSAAPTQVPALTIPGSPAAMHSMEMSGRPVHAAKHPATGMMGSMQSSHHQ
jgi:predicted metal-binding membrane protein